MSEVTPQPPVGSKRKTEKILVVAALLLLLFSAGFLYFDDWLWSGLRSRDQVIGVITSRSGDVRMKFDQDVSWQKAAQGQSLQYNDSIFAGDSSQAELKVGQSDLTVTQNSLVVLRRERDQNFLNLNYGTLFGKVDKKDKILIDTGSGKPTLLKTDSEARIVLKKVGESTQLQVVSGKAEVEIDGVKKILDKNTEITLPKADPSLAKNRVEPPPNVDLNTAPPAPPVEQKLDLALMPPSPQGLVYDANPRELVFQWQYGLNRAIQPSDQFVLEFSKTPDFSVKVLARNVTGQNTASLNASKSNQLYYRVRGPKGELSPISNFTYVRMQPPEIIRPQVSAIYKVAPRGQRDVVFEVRRDALKPAVWSQISSDSEFETVLVNESHDNDRWLKPMPAGRYFMRVRSDYGQNQLSGWSPAVPFAIEESAPKVHVPVAQLEKRLTIPNAPYPERLYGASDEETQNFLSEKGFGRDFFADMKDHYDQLSLDFGKGEDAVNVKDAALPKSKLYPSTFSYRYQLQKAGKLPSNWSAPERLTIDLEPPKETGVEVVYEQLKNDGQIPVKIGYTPVLFAKNYEFQIATNVRYQNAKTYVDAKNTKNLKLAANKDYYWRVRALDQDKRPISGYSESRHLTATEVMNQLKLAKREQQKRGIASTDSLAPTPETRASQKMTTEYQREHRFWTWLGTGYNYVDFKQTYSDRGNVGSQSQNDNFGQYLEVGYKGDRGFGVVAGYKNTPGKVIVTNAQLDKNNYNWSTMSLEGIFLTTSNYRPFGKRLDYGPRIGIQQHNVPYMFLNANDTLELKENTILTGSLGLMGDIWSGHWRHHAYMRYQMPVSSKGADGQFDVKSKLTFDGLLGSSYYFTPSIKFGIFWYGQMLYYETNYLSGGTLNSGTQSLFYSNMDLRFGFEF